MTIYAFDFFCGAGGLTRGLTNAGIKVLAGFDIDGLCKESYEYNNPGSKFVTADIKSITFSQLYKLAGNIRPSEMLFAGCAPCQPFSRQVKNGVSKHAPTLLGEFGKLIKAFLPGQILMENVPGMAKIKGNSTFRRFLALLNNNGYKFSFDIVDAKQYGVPQTRRRLLLVAFRGRKPNFPKPVYGTGLKPYKTVRQAISHFPKIVAGARHDMVPNHVTASIMDLNLERLKCTPKDGGDRRAWPKHLRLACHSGNYDGHTDVYGRMAWDSPAPTLTGRCNSISNGRYAHPVQNRAISLREAAALQSFPDGYIFFGASKNIAQQIGNAVPVRLAEHFGKHILEHLELR